MTAPVLTIAELDAQQRALQAANADAVARAILAYWLLRVNGEDLAGTSGPWLDFAVSMINRGYLRSYELALAYADALRRIEIPGAEPLRLPPPAPPSEQKLRRSLSYTGPGTAAVELAKTPDKPTVPKTATPEERERAERIAQSRQERVRVVMETAGAKAAATTYKNVQNGGRDLVDDLVVTKVAVGYLRVTRDAPCGFCLMLASRGPVYAEDSFDESNARFTGPGQHKVHDSCGCLLRPLYSRGEQHWTPTARRADQLWKDVSRETGKTGDAMINEFRKAARKLGLADLTR